MKSIYHGTAGANCKLRGKKTKMLSCFCCDLFNFKEKYRDVTDKKEIQDFKKGRCRDDLHR